MSYEGSSSTGGGHIPVLTEPLMELLAPSAEEVAVDCTVGLGGHAKALLEREGSIRLIGLDMDTLALSRASTTLAPWKEHVSLIHANFSDLSSVLSSQQISGVDMLYADIGVSSMQLDQPERGFSLQQDGPLDMRMDISMPKRAADLVNSLKEPELSDLIYKYGEEGKSRKIAKLICQVRRSHRIDSTLELASLVCHALGIDPNKVGNRIHPATRTFQALRIAVNHELDNLESLLREAPKVLNAGGRFAVISFHSLEDRLVKEDFRKRADEGIYKILTPKPIEAEASEILRNSRSRSAKLRVVQKV